jgi:hypothetical protein
MVRKKALTSEEIAAAKAQYPGVSNATQMAEINKRDPNTSLQVARERAKISGVQAPELVNGELAYRSTPEEEAFKRETEQQKILNSPEALALAQRQQAEGRAITEMNTPEAQLSVKERNVQAGLASLSSISQTLGLGGQTIPLEVSQGIGTLEEKGVPGATAASMGLTALGKVVNVKIAGFSINDLFSKSNQGNIKNLQGDASKMTREVTRISRAATTKGANVQEAIISMNKLEEGVRSRYADAEMALTASPSDVAEGLSLSEDLSYNLRTIVEQRQALERYQLIGDPKEVLLMVGEAEAEEILATE